MKSWIAGLFERPTIVLSEQFDLFASGLLLCVYVMMGMRAMVAREA